MINSSQDLTVRRLESRKWSEEASPKWLQRSVNRSLANRFSLCCSTILSSPCRDRLRCYARRIGAHPHARPLAPWTVPGGWRKFLSRQRKQRASVSYLPDMGSHAWSLQRSFLVKPYSYPEQQSFYYTISDVCLVVGGGGGFIMTLTMQCILQRQYKVWVELRKVWTEEQQLYSVGSYTLLFSSSHRPKAQ